jgi:hypothetical protein
MSTLQIDLYDVKNDRRLWVSLRDNLPIQDLIQKLVIDLELPQGEYELRKEETKKVLPLDSTLKKEGIQDEDLLRLQKKKKVPPVVPIPIIPPGKVSADSSVESPEEITGKTKPAKKAGEKEQFMPEKEKAPPKPPKGERLPPPPPRPHRPHPGPKGPHGFWHRPFPQPRFLRWIPMNFWFYFRPIIILVILLIMILCYLVGLCVCRKSTTVDIPDAIPMPNAMTDEQAMEESEITSYDEATFTFEDPNLYDAYSSGEALVEADEEVELYDYEGIFEAVSWLNVTLMVTSPENDPGTELVFIPIAMNESADPVRGYHSIYLKEVNSGEEYYGRVKSGSGTIEIYNYGPSKEGWTKINLKEISFYESNKGCAYYTAYIALNINEPPFDNLDLRKALLYGFDAESFFETSGYTNYQMAQSFIPPNILDMYSIPMSAMNTPYYDLTKAQSYLQAAESAGVLADKDILWIYYCGECTGMDWEAAEILNVYARTLGLYGESIEEEYETHFYTPMEGSERPLSLATLGHTNFYSFINYAIKNGSFTFPDEGLGQVRSLLEKYAHEEDLGQQQKYIKEIERLVVEEYAVVIPVYYFEFCN